MRKIKNLICVYFAKLRMQKRKTQKSKWNKILSNWNFFLLNWKLRSFPFHFTTVVHWMISICFKSPYLYAFLVKSEILFCTYFWNPCVCLWKIPGLKLGGNFFTVPWSFSNSEMFNCVFHISQFNPNILGENQSKISRENTCMI